MRYYCEKTLELGETYKPPLPTMVRVSLTPIEAITRIASANNTICRRRQPPYSTSDAST